MSNVSVVAPRFGDSDGKIAEGVRSLGADVEYLIVGVPVQRRAGEQIGHVTDVREGARLRAVAENREGFPCA